MVQQGDQSNSHKINAFPKYKKKYKKEKIIESRKDQFYY